MSNVRKALVPDLKNKKVSDIVALVRDTYNNNNLSIELELQFIQLAISSNPQLGRAAKANPESLYNSILQAAECGLSLNPQWQEGYFVPYNMKIDGKEIPTVTFSPMYRGKKKLLIAKNVVKNITTQLVYDDELFNESIVDGVHTIDHTPDSFNRSDDSKIVGGYAVTTLNNGEMQYVVKGRDYFERCKAASAMKMGGKTSPAWKLWYDIMCKKCLINAADSEIPKIGVNSKTTKLLNNINTNDIDYIDISSDQKIISEPKKINDSDFSNLISQLQTYSLSLDMARKKYKGYDFTPTQIEQIKEAGTITPKRLDEIIKLALEDDSFDINDLEMVLNENQINEVQQAIVYKETNNG